MSHEIAESNFFQKTFVLKKISSIVCVPKTVIPFPNSWAAFASVEKLGQIRFKEKRKRIEGQERWKVFSGMF